MRQLPSVLRRCQLSSFSAGVVAIRPSLAFCGDFSGIYLPERKPPPRGDQLVILIPSLGHKSLNSYSMSRFTRLYWYCPVMKRTQPCESLTARAFMSCHASKLETPI